MFFLLCKKTDYTTTEFIEFDYVKKMVDFCDEAKSKYVILTGGEPTLYPRLAEIIKYIKSKKSKLIATIATNGTLLDNFDYCKKLIDCGLDYVDVSLKGWDSVSFSNVTGCNCFLQQLQAIRNLSTLGVDFTCSMVITPRNVDSYCDAIEKAIDSGASKFSFTFVIDNESGEIKDTKYLEKNNPFALVDSFLSHIDRLEAITKGEWWIEYSFPMCVYTDEQLKALEGRLAAPCQIYYRNGVTFDAKMNLIPCSMNIETTMGKFGSDFVTYKEFKKLSQKGVYKSSIDELNKLPSEHCKTCKYLKICRGGCTFFWKHCSFEAFKIFKEKWNDFRWLSTTNMCLNGEEKWH